MPRIRLLLFGLLLHCSLGGWGLLTAQAQENPVVKVRSAPFVRMPGAHEFGEVWGVDGNSPAERSATGGLLIFNSLQYPWRSAGANLFEMQPTTRVVIRNRDAIEGGLWLEATYRDADGTLFGWVHNEIDPNCENEFLKVPQIRQMVSHDDGYTWEDLGVLLAAPSNTFRCDTANMYFAGGNGDFSVCFDEATEYFYFYFTTYSREFHEQGISSARLKYSDRYNPVGKVWRWNGGSWDEPGIGGRGAVIFPPASDWHFTEADAYWGPAVHYNTYLRRYVMLLNHAINEAWGTEGFYLSFNEDLSNPAGWTALQRVPLELDSPYMAYPQVIGLEADGTDKVAGHVARFFVSGVSYWELQFDWPWQVPVRPARPDGKDPYPQRNP